MKANARMRPFRPQCGLSWEEEPLYRLSRARIIRASRRLDRPFVNDYWQADKRYADDKAIRNCRLVLVKASHMNTRNERITNTESSVQWSRSTESRDTRTEQTVCQSRNYKLNGNEIAPRHGFARYNASSEDLEIKPSVYSGPHGGFGVRTNYANSSMAIRKLTVKGSNWHRPYCTWQPDTGCQNLSGTVARDTT